MHAPQHRRKVPARIATASRVRATELDDVIERDSRRLVILAHDAQQVVEFVADLQALKQSMQSLMLRCEVRCNDSTVSCLVFSQVEVSSVVNRDTK